MKERLSRVCTKELRYTLDSEHSISFGAALLGAINSGKNFNENSTYEIEGDKLEGVEYNEWQLPEEIVQQSTSLEIEMMSRDQINRDTAASKNELESFIFECREQLDLSDLQSFLDEKQKTDLSQLLLEFDEWCSENHNQTLNVFFYFNF